VQPSSTKPPPAEGEAFLEAPPGRALRGPVFVTGATGFVGANLVRELTAGGMAVRALVRAGSDTSSLEGLPVEIREGSITDREGLGRHLKGCGACFHVAAALTNADPSELETTNVGGTRAVLEAALDAGCSAILHTSTMGTLARPDGRPARETDFWLAPNASDYVRSKFAAEKVARDLASRGAPIVIVHPAAPVGPWDRTPTVTGRRILDVLAGKVPRWIAGEIHHVAVEDVARGMILAARKGKPGQNYLLGLVEGNLTLADFVSLVARAAEMPPPAIQGAGVLRRWFQALRRADRSPSHGGPGSLACDPAWTVRELGLPQTPLGNAFREAVHWFRARGMAR
jgi:dihydroflavonol-4-reductase